MKYIPADKLIAEIERQITDNTFGAKLELIDLLSFIESLEKEEPPRICPKCIHYKEDIGKECHIVIDDFYITDYGDFVWEDLLER